MIKKLKLVAKVSKKGIKKILRGDLMYRDKNPISLTKAASIHIYKYGPTSFARKLKQEMIAINRRIGNNLAFPNGLVSGADAKTTIAWYKHHHKKVTIVIPSYNDLAVLVPCLDSIAETTNPEYVKVIIVDDYCQPEHSKKLKKLENDQVTILFRKKNGGFAKAVNSGMLAVPKKQDIIVLNSDIVAHKGWVEALQYGAYEFGIDTGIVGPKLLYPDGRIQSAGSHRNTEVPEFFDHYYRFQESNYGPANIPQYCIGVTGACMYIKRDFINKVGILDGKFQFAFEDMDICIRGWEAGYRTLYFPIATLTHHESVTRGKNKTISAKEKQSIDYFWKKWGKWFDERNVVNKAGKRRIIFVLQTIGLSGGIKNIFEQANRLHDRGFEVEIWSLDKSKSPWETRGGLKLRSFKNYERLTDALSKEEAIKVATWWETAFPVWLSSVTKGIPVYFISEFETWFYPDNVVAQSSVVACYRKEFRNITISPYNLDELHDIGLKATIIPCGYDKDTFKPLKGAKKRKDVLIGVGRSFFQKNFEMTYNSWKALGNKRPKMWLYGFEPELAKRDSKIQYFNKPSSQEINKFYNEATVFIQTSRHEGFCLPILEAMAAGCPVICTDAHGNRGFCENEKNCLIVGQDDIQGAKKAIERLMNDEKLRNKLSKNALNTVKEYQWDSIMDKSEEFFSKVK